MARGVAQDLAAGRVRRRVVDAGGGERCGVDEGGVTAGVRERHRIVRRSGRERVVHREPFDGGGGRRAPLLLVPAAPEDPLARLRLGGSFGDLRDDRLPGRIVGQAEDLRRLTDRGEVARGFRSARERRAFRRGRCGAFSVRCELAMSASAPSATIRPSRAASAVTSGRSGSRVTIRPFSSTRSAGGSGVSGRVRSQPPRASVRQSAAAIRITETSRRSMDGRFYVRAQDEVARRWSPGTRARQRAGWRATE